METILNVKNVSKTYQGAGQTLTVLDDVNFSVEAGSTLSIVGPSGSGKTTLLGLCAGLDRSMRARTVEARAIASSSGLGFTVLAKSSSISA